MTGTTGTYWPLLEGTRERLMMTGYKLLVGALAVSVALATGSAKAQDLKKVTVVSSTAGVHAPYWVGMEKGFFKDAGFDVSWREVASSVDRVTVVSQGDAVMAGTGSQAIVAVMGQGNKNFYWVGIPDSAQDISGIVARGDVKTLKDLKGKKLAIQFGGSEEIVDYYLLNTVGLDMYKDVQLVNLKQSEMIQAMKQGLIDAAGAWYPEYARLQEIDGTRKIASVADLGFWEKYRQIPAPNALVVSKKFVDQDPAGAKRFLAAYWKSQQWVIDNQAEAAKISAKISKQSEDEWLAWEKVSVRLTRKDQAQQMSDNGAYPIMDKMIDFMHDTIKKIDSKPNYREWVRQDLVTGQ
jgi:ABC-type nitrate/sulfonate/bicarbonate transport system substrate-binding protein